MGIFLLTLDIEPSRAPDLLCSSHLLTDYRAKIVGVSFGEVDPFSLDTVEIYEKALLEAQQKGIPVKVFLLCNPHNPLGKSLAQNTNH